MVKEMFRCCVNLRFRYKKIIVVFVEAFGQCFDTMPYAFTLLFLLAQIPKNQIV